MTKGLGPNEEEIRLLTDLQADMAREMKEHGIGMRQMFMQLEANMCDKFRELREDRQWSQLQVSERLAACGIEMHQTTVAKMEKGKRPLRVAEMFALAQIFGLPAGAIFFMPRSGLTYGMEYMTRRLEAIDSMLNNMRERFMETFETHTSVYADAKVDQLWLAQAMRRVADNASGASIEETSDGEHSEEA